MLDGLTLSDYFDALYIRARAFKWEVNMDKVDVEALRDVTAGPMATCVWLEGPTGMMSTPDMIKFIT